MQGTVQAGTAEATKPSFTLLPAVGEHMLRFQGRRVWISRSEKRSESPLEPQHVDTPAHGEPATKPLGEPRQIEVHSSTVPV